MRKLILISVILFLLSSCKKEKGQNQFTGTWEYATFIGYSFGDYSMPAGNGRVISFEKNGTFKRYAHDTLLFKGTYYLKLKRDCAGSGLRSFIYTTDNTFVNGNSIDERNDSLFIASSTCMLDGGVVIYRRLK